MRDYAITFRVGAAARNLDALCTRLDRLQDKAHKLGFTIEETRVKGYESRGRRTDAGETTGTVLSSLDAAAHGTQVPNGGS